MIPMQRRERSTGLAVLGIVVLALAGCATPEAGVDAAEDQRPAAARVAARPGAALPDVGGPRVREASAEPDLVETSTPAGAFDPGPRTLPEARGEIWNTPAFTRRFMESYLAETDVEPPVTLPEREVVQAVYQRLADEEVDEALQTLELSATSAASAVFDFMLGNLYYEKDRLDDAVARYRIATDKHPAYRRAWRQLGQVLSRLNRHEEAHDAFVRYFETGAADAISYGLLGSAHKSLGNFLAAEQSFRMAMVLDPETVKWQIGLAEALFHQSRFPEAIVLMESLLAQYPDRTEFWRMQARAFIGNKQPMEAAKNYEMVEQLGGSTLDSLANLGNIYINEGIYELGVDAYVRMLERFPEANISRVLLAARQLAARGAANETRLLADTVEETRSADLTDSQRKTLLELQARLAVAGGATADEIALLERIVALDPLDGDAILRLGLHSRAAEDFEKAIFYFERAAALEAFEGTAKLEHGKVLVAMERYKDAVPLLERALMLTERDDVREYLAQVKPLAQSSE